MWLRGEERRKLRLRRSTAAVTAASSGSAMRFWVGRNRHATPCRPLRRHGTAGAGRQRPSGQLAGASRSDRGASRAGTKRRVPALLRGAHAGRSSRGARCRPWHHRRHPQPSRRPRRQRLPTFRRSTFSLRTLATQAIEASRRDPADERRAVPVPGSGLVLPPLNQAAPTVTSTYRVRIGLAPPKTRSSVCVSAGFQPAWERLAVHSP